MSDEKPAWNELTPKDVAGEVDWLGGWGDVIDFDGADWSTADENGEIRLEGRTHEGGYITATFKLIKFQADSPGPEWDEGEGDDE